jgi:hypothetical protein
MGALPMMTPSEVRIVRSLLERSASMASLGDYEAFLQRRRGLVAQRLNQFLGFWSAECAQLDYSLS